MLRNWRVVILTFVLFVAGAHAKAQGPESSAPIYPLELVTASAQPATSAQERAAALELLSRATQNGNLYAAGTPPFSLRASFDSSGSGGAAGLGEIEETRVSHQLGRWTARLGDYSQTRIYNHGQAYDLKSADAMPLRLQMIRGVLFWPLNRAGTRAFIRAAPATWNGTRVTCLLLSAAVPHDTPSLTGGRRWEETEYCIDPKDGLLQIYSEAPGIYATFDYRDALHFHSYTLAREISVSEGSSAVLRIRVEGLADAVIDANTFTPTAEMLAHPRGAFMAGPFRFRQNMPALAQSGDKIESVIVHAAIDSQGKVIEAEALPNSNPGLSETALEFVKNSTYTPDSGAPRQREAFINVSITPR